MSFGLPPPHKGPSSAQPTSSERPSLTSPAPGALSRASPVSSGDVDRYLPPGQVSPRGALLHSENVSSLHPRGRPEGGDLRHVLMDRLTRWGAAGFPIRAKLPPLPPGPSSPQGPDWLHSPFENPQGAKKAMSSPFRRQGKISDQQRALTAAPSTNGYADCPGGR